MSVVGSMRTAMPRAPDGGWGWMVVFGSFMIHVITDGVTYSFGVFYDEFLTYFQQGKGPTAWILSILVGVTLCSGPISSMFVNRWGCRTVTIIGAILAGVCMVISIWANSIYILYLTIGLGTGLGFGLIYLPAIVSVSMYFENQRSLATGIAVCGSGFGTFIFAPLITKLLEIFTWQMSMLIIAGVVFLCVIFGALFRPLKQSIIQHHPRKATLAKEHFQRGPCDKNTRKYRSSDEIRSTYGTMNRSLVRSTKSEGGCFMQRNDNDLMHRPDIFYQRSLMSIGNRSELFESQDFEDVEDLDVSRTCCDCCADGNKIVHRMLGISLFKDPIFVVFVMSNFLTSIGFNIPYVYIVSRAKSLGLNGKEAGLVLSAIGIANTIGRIVLGYFSDKPWVNRLMVYNISLALCGLATILSHFCTTFALLIVYGCVFGFTIGAYVGLTSVILVDLLGLDKLTNAFGLLLLFQGIASLIGPPIAGELYDIFQSYDPGFYMAGVAISLSGLILFLIPFIQNLRKKNKKRPMPPTIYNIDA